MEFLRFTFNQESKTKRTYKLSDLINVDIEESDIYQEVEETVSDYEELYSQLKKHIYITFSNKYRSYEEFVLRISEELCSKLFSTLKQVYRRRLFSNKRNNYREVNHRYLHLKYLNDEDEIVFTLNNEPDNLLEKNVEKKVKLEVKNLLSKVTTSSLIDIYIEYKIKYLIQQQKITIINHCKNSELTKLDFSFQYDYNKFDFSHNEFIDEVSYQIGEALYNSGNSITLEDLERVMGLRSSFTKIEPWDISDLKRVSNIASGKPIFKSTTVLFQFRSLTESIYNDGPAIEEKKDKYRTKIFIDKIDIKEVNGIIDKFNKFDYQFKYFGVELGLINLLLSTLIMAKSSESEVVKVKASKLINGIWMKDETSKTKRNKFKRLYYILKVLDKIKIDVLNIPYHSDIRDSKLWDIQFEYLGNLKLNKEIEDALDDFYFYFKPGSWKSAFLDKEIYFAKINKNIFHNYSYRNNRFFFRAFSYLIFVFRSDNRNLRKTKIKAIKLFEKIIDYDDMKYENELSDVKSKLLKKFFVALKELIKRGWEIKIENDRFNSLLNDLDKKIDKKQFVSDDIRYLKQIYIIFTPPDELIVDMPVKSNQSPISEEFRNKLIYYLNQPENSQFKLAGKLEGVHQPEISEIKCKKRNSIGKEKYNAIKNEIYSD
ncbi:hypothetical protein [Halanaerobium sp. ST460_2HS_T2]|uniref:hypothetical protein n=1 Tax=Halanaerobium sp. ST460_2HS_T2 TaxID=2183914 RepID=UPI000DF450D9|nr:hypothetical protein [Halanaerobium sp. ST460_2HS_T2]RCW60176.1 hypothetical protein DFR80_10819 [Halanaerobium sp. ST460_2HS_T2]